MTKKIEHAKVEVGKVVTVTEQISYEVPREEYESGEYARPRKVGEIIYYPVYKNKVYYVPVIVNKECIKWNTVEKETVKYNVKEVEEEVRVPKIRYHEDVNIVETQYEVKVPNLVIEDQRVVNAVIEDKKVINAIVENKKFETFHPTMLCKKCEKEKV